MSGISELVEVTEKVAKTFEEFKKVNDQRVEEVEKKNEARAAELSETLQKISADLDGSVKDRKIAEKKYATLTERLEILESLNERPRGAIQEKAQAEVKDAFFKLFRSGFQDMDARQSYKQAIEKAREVKAATIGTAADGGYAVPEEISRSIDSLVLKLSDVASAVKVVTAGTSDYKELVSIHGTTSAWSAETGTRSETATAQLRERAPTWGELYAYPKASNWLLEDSFFDVASWLVQDASEGMSQAISAAIYNGNGNSKPTGIFNTAPTAVADYASPMRAATTIEYVPCDATSPQTVSSDDIIDLVYKLAPRYRSGSQFMMNTVTQGYVRKLKDSNGQYLWQPSLQAGQPDMLLGYPVGTWEDLADPTTADGFSVVFGNFARAYVLVQRSGMAIDRESFTTPGYTKFYLRKRYGGCVLNNDAVKALKLADA